MHCLTTKSLVEIFEQFLTLTTDGNSSQVNTTRFCFKINKKKILIFLFIYFARCALIFMFFAFCRHYHGVVKHFMKNMDLSLTIYFKQPRTISSTIHFSRALNFPTFFVLFSRLTMFEANERSLMCHCSKYGCLMIHIRKKKYLCTPAHMQYEMSIKLANEFLLPLIQYLDCIWNQIKSLENNDWNENLISRPYKPFENILNAAIQHEFPLIIPPEFNDKLIYPLPKVVFRMFDYTDVPEVRLYS